MRHTSQTVTRRLLRSRVGHDVCTCKERTKTNLLPARTEYSQVVMVDTL